MPLPKDNALRKALPLFTFLTEYFPDAILELVKVSVAGNMQHNPGEPMHWARGKSMDQLNTAQRHMWDYATTGPYNDEPPLPPEILAAIGGEPPMHLANAAWRLLAQIQLDCEQRAEAERDIAAGTVELFPDAYALTPDPPQPEERIVGMHPALGAPFGADEMGRALEAASAAVVIQTALDVLAPVHRATAPGRLQLGCGCYGYCKGAHPEVVAEPVLVPTGTTEAPPLVVCSGCVKPQAVCDCVAAPVHECRFTKPAHQFGALVGYHCRCGKFEPRLG